jgi:membrane protease YdiL (CAAX protease family)
VGIALGLGGTGVPTSLGVLGALALYVLSVRLIEQRLPDELALAQLAPELAMGVTLGATLGMLLASGAYALTGPTAAAPWQPLTDSLEGAVEELIFRCAIFRLLWMPFGITWALVVSSVLFGAIHLIKPVPT